MSGFTLKLIAALFMLFEHSTTLLGEVVSLLDTLNLPAHYLGRIVAPLFFFLSVEGFFKTSNRSRYLQRAGIWLLLTSALLICAVLLVMQLYQMTWTEATGKAFSLPRSLFFPLGLNIFTSIFMGLLLLMCIERCKGCSRMQKAGRILLCVLVGIGILFTEASITALASYLIFYFAYGNKRKTCIFYVIWSLLSLASTLQGGLQMGMMVSLKVNFQYFQILALPLILLYNGERGKYSWKYFFYGFYPAHLAVLFLLRWLLFA